MKKLCSKLLLGFVCFGSLFATQANAHIFLIKNPHDTTDETSLRGAIIAANRRGGNNTILLAKGTYRLTIPGADEDAARTGDLDVTAGRLAIVGVSAAKVIIDAGGLGDRVFHVLPGAELTLDDLTIRGGTAPGGESGGGILNAGHLWLHRCVVQSNYTATGLGGFVGGTGGHGGGIYNTGWLTLDRCRVSENATAGGGGGGIDPNAADSTSQGPGGNGGSGAGICSAGILTLDDCTISKNVTGDGGMGGCATASQPGSAGGKSGDGGGVFNGGKLVLNRCTLSGNSTGPGGGGGGSYFDWGDDSGLCYTPGGPGGNGGDGAAIYNTGDLTLVTSTVSGNTNGAGGNGFDGAGSGGNGGIYSLGPLTIRSCTISSNSGGEGGFGYSFMGEYFQGCGGNGGIVNATNSSLATLRNSLVALNLVGPGGVFFAIYDPTTQVWILSGPSPDLSGPFTSGGYNLIGQTDGSTGLTNGVNGDLVGTGTPPLNPLLGPLQDNGGPTLTHALLRGSPAIDQGKRFGESTDQRGMHRPYDFPSIPNASGGDGTDIGAFELEGSIRDAPTAVSHKDP
jgi:hypothetical protein